MTQPVDTPGEFTGHAGHPTRRTLLKTAGIVALTGGSAGTLVACAGGADGPTPAPTSASAPPDVSAPASAPPSSGGPSSAVPSSGPPTPETPPTPRKPKVKVPSGPSVAVAEVPVGGGVILKNADYVVTQPKKGTFKAFNKTCTHKGCPVAAVRDGVIHCNCHGSEYSIEDGSVVNPPAQRGLAEAEVEVVGKKVYVSD